MKAGNNSKNSNPDASGASPPTWIRRGDIRRIPGALKPGAYVARAYLHHKETGRLPAWAHKTESGKWGFDRDYILSDAAINRTTIGVSEAAELAGTSRRTIQTWVDEGVLKSSTDDRKTGESRHIDRQAFLEALPELRSRLEHAAPPGKVPDRFNEGSLSSEERRSLARLHQRLAEARGKREAVLREAQLAERSASSQQNASARLLARINKLRQQFSERLKSLEKSLAYAENKRSAESARRERLLQRAEEMQAHEAEIERALTVQLASAKKAQAEALARQLDEARRPVPAANADAGERLGQFRDLAKSVDAREAEAEMANSVLYAAAVSIAESIVDDIEDGLLDRIDGAIRFNDRAEQKHIPLDIRIAVTRDFFSHG